MDIYDEMLNDFVAHAEGRTTSSRFKHCNTYKHKKSAPGYSHPNKEKLIGNKNKMQIPESLVRAVARKSMEENITVSAAWKALGSKFTLAGVARRVRLYKETLNVQ